MKISKIEWCDATWNPVTGCLCGCKYCYAKRIAERFGAHWKSTSTIEYLEEPYREKEKINSYPFDFKPTFHEYRLQETAKFKKPKNIFVVSMGDLFGDWVPDEWIDEVFQACFNADRHRYMFLTKNPKRYDTVIDYISGEERGTEETEYWNNMWFGTTITCQADMERITHLETFSEGHKFLSVEPILEKIELDLSGIRCPSCGSVMVYQDNPATTPKGIPQYYCDDCGEWEGNQPAKLIEWVIVGAQTGPGAKETNPEWVQSIIDQCRVANIPIFLKNNLNWPEKIQEFPWDERR